MSCIADHLRHTATLRPQAQEVKQVDDASCCSSIAIRSILSDAHGNVAFIDSYFHIFGLNLSSL
ncbi:hypothetical protein D9613_012912 [Agrocybe pediades]|uniref:Uncharacterized protein n=1 Tax=Agrocybe pediades TaxID=84607 RepID=A0A8H4QRW7_9AGAR|nr:hypothetical protein D9613_012912 [Agrocybe pediades]